MLSAALGDRELPETRRAEIVELAAVHPISDVRDLFERFLPPEKRVRRLGTTIDEDALLALTGDSKRGRHMFFEATGVTCHNCHQINGRGTAVGPDLSGIGAKYKKYEILENILRPSKKIDPEYRTHVVLTADGQVLTGLLVERTETRVVLQDANGKTIHVATDEVQVVRSQARSIMPEMLLQDFTVQQAADLIEFLASLKKTAPATVKETIDFNRNRRKKTGYTRCD